MSSRDTGEPAVLETATANVQKLVKSSVPETVKVTTPLVGGTVT